MKHDRGGRRGLDLQPTPEIPGLKAECPQRFAIVAGRGREHGEGGAAQKSSPGARGKPARECAIRVRPEREHEVETAEVGGEIVGQWLRAVELGPPSLMLGMSDIDQPRLQREFRGVAIARELDAGVGPAFTEKL
jgi:hypothetical protein